MTSQYGNTPGQKMCQPEEFHCMEKWVGKNLYVLFNVLCKVIDQSRERILRDIKHYYVVTVE